MENIVNNKILKILTLLKEHKCIAPKILDVREICGWTDYILIATVSSSAHLRGVLRYIREQLDEEGIVINKNSINFDDENWLFIDCFYFTINLMTATAREFYELENLWYKAKVIDYSS